MSSSEIQLGSQMKLVFTLTISALLLITSSLYAISHEGDNDAFTDSGELHEVHVDEAGQDAIGLKIEPVKKGIIQDALSATGEVNAAETQTSIATSPVAGVVKTVLSKKGDTVTKGQILAVVHSVDVATNFADLLNTRSQINGEIARTRTEFKAQIALQNKELELAKQLYDRQATLVNEGISAGKDYQAAKNSFEKAEVQLQSLLKKSKEEVSLREQQLKVRLDSGRGQLRILGLTDAAITEALRTGSVNTDLAVRSAISGTIIERTISPGQTVAAAQQTFSIISLSPIWVVVDIFQEQLQKISLGQKVLIKTPANQELTGHIENISAIVDPKEKTVHVRIITDNIAHLLKPGMFVHANILQGKTSVGNITIPVNAIVQHQDRPLVFVQEDDHFAPKYVQLGSQTVTQAEILSGLSVGDKLVVQGATQLKAQAMRPEAHGDEHGATSEHGDEHEHGAKSEHGDEHEHGATSEHGDEHEHGAKSEHGDEHEHGAKSEHGDEHDEHGAAEIPKERADVMFAFVLGALSVLLLLGVWMAIAAISKKNVNKREQETVETRESSNVE